MGSNFSHMGIRRQVVVGEEEGLWCDVPHFPLGLHVELFLSLSRSETDVITDMSTMSAGAAAGLRAGHRGDGSPRFCPLSLVTLFLHED